MWWRCCWTGSIGAMRSSGYCLDPFWGLVSFISLLLFWTLGGVFVLFVFAFQTFLW